MMKLDSDNSIAVCGCLNARFHHQDHLDFVKHLNYLLDDFKYHMTSYEFKCLKTAFMFNFLEVNNEGMCS